MLVLQVSYSGRMVTPEHITQMAKTLGVKDPGTERSIFNPFGAGPKQGQPSKLMSMMSM